MVVACTPIIPLPFAQSVTIIQTLFTSLVFQLHRFLLLAKIQMDGQRFGCPRDLNRLAVRKEEDGLLSENR